MKRFFFSLIALSAAAIGCTQSALLETPEQFGTEITFSPYTGRTPVTKATEIANANALNADGGFNILCFLNKAGESPRVYLDARVKKAGSVDTETPDSDVVETIYSSSTIQPSLTGSYNGQLPDGWTDNKENGTNPSIWRAVSEKQLDGSWSTWKISEILTGGYWDYPGTIYWPDSQSSSTLSFVAFSNNVYGADHAIEGGDDLIEWTKGTNDEDLIKFSVPETVTDQVDFLATSFLDGLSLNNTPGGMVYLYFNHLLSRVGFKVQSTTSKEVTITSLTFTGDMPTQGTLDLYAAVGDNAIPELVPTAVGTPIYDCMTGDSGAAGAIDDEGNTNSVRVPGTEYLMIMPHIVGAEYDSINTDELKGSDHKVNVTYTIGAEKQTRTAEVTLPIGFEFVAGKAYEIVLKISTSSLSFDVEEQDWNNPNGNNNAEINPNDPPVPGDEEEEEPAPIVYTETSITGSNLEFRISEVTNSSATVTLRVLNGQYQDTEYKSSALTTSTADVGELKIVYRQKGSDAWNVAKTMDSSPYGIRYECTFSNLDPEIEYECCVYIKNREITSYKDNWKGGKDPQFTSFDEGYGQKDAQGNRHYLTFITKSPFIYPVLTIDEAAAVTKDANNLFSTEIQASYSLGYLNSNPIKIKEYGICWVKGEDDPTLEDDKERWMVPADAEETSYLFKSSLNHLKPNTTYSYAAYVIIDQDVDVYEATIDSPILPRYQRLYSKDEIVYSTIKSFKTGIITNDSNNTQDGWGSGGTTNFE